MHTHMTLSSSFSKMTSQSLQDGDIEWGGLPVILTPSKKRTVASLLSPQTYKPLNLLRQEILFVSFSNISNTELKYPSQQIKMELYSLP